MVKLAKFPTCIVLTAALALMSSAQNTPSPGSDSSSQPQSPSTTQSQSPDASKPSAGQATQSTDSDKDKANQDKTDPQTSGKVAGTSNDRLFYTLPNFLTLQGKKQLPPMTTGQKFKVVALGTFDYVEYPWWAILAAISQADNGNPAFGQGWEAYAKRYGVTAGDSLVENFMVGAVFPSVLRQDPRFYQSGQGNFWRRSGYAVSRIVVTRSDSGRSQFNYSEIFGAATAAAISSYSYHPGSTYLSTPTNPHKFIPSERTFSNAASTWGTQIGLDTVTIFVKEFWPDIHRKISKKHDVDNGTQAPAATP